MYPCEYMWEENLAPHPKKHSRHFFFHWWNWGVDNSTLCTNFHFSSFHDERWKRKFSPDFLFCKHTRSASRMMKKKHAFEAAKKHIHFSRRLRPSRERVAWQEGIEDREALAPRRVFGKKAAPRNILLRYKIEKFSLPLLCTLKLRSSFSTENMIYCQARSFQGYPK